jgi:DNA polymerase-3 subunit chi
MAAGARADFYLLQSADRRTRLLTACRIAEKAFEQGLRVSILAGGPDEAAELDDLLWTFQQNSFVPHSVYQDAGAAPAPVLLAHDAEPDASSQVLINLAAEVPLFFSRFERVAELVDESAEVRRSGRSRYTFYKERGYPLRTHEIKG